VEPATSDAIVEPERSSDQIEHDMERTRSSITEKVAALENQVLGTIQTATNTVTDTVDAVKEAVATAPTAVRDTLREIVEVGKETVRSFSATECIRSNPAAALGTAAFAGFLTGFFTARSPGRSRPQPMAALPPAPQAAMSIPTRPPGFLGELLQRLGGEVQQMAERTLSTGLTALQSSIEKRLPTILDGVVERMAGPRDHRMPAANGATNRDYSVRAPA